MNQALGSSLSKQIRLVVVKRRPLWALARMQLLNFQRLLAAGALRTAQLVQLDHRRVTVNTMLTLTLLKGRQVASCPTYPGPIDFNDGFLRQPRPRYNNMPFAFPHSFVAEGELLHHRLEGVWIAAIASYCEVVVVIESAVFRPKGNYRTTSVFALIKGHYPICQNLLVQCNTGWSDFLPLALELFVFD